ncbi:XTP/dITP diphosphatase [Methanohalophilus sp. WG1-DM]|jgi:XTP/dITP diphosphohydrolase|uniref:XTP/dITP diphosphatase n=1 Tax=Methanohalophilus sp. WG1-DM TaxID=2491675 RepID=UPI000FFF5D7A|nr:XTP/dITP diphosphatase [Methanohalophilus sp. WG1-DM]RXG34033.1 dITP/XTP pyrophosphatase [Methanohalophilus sp. WG1-DM]
MHKIVFVTGNSGKFREIKAILGQRGIEVLQNTDGYPELQEDDLEPIAAEGARWACEKLGMPVMVDDSGLFIDALNGFPGPYSAFVEDKLGNPKVLKLMEDEENRSAYFKSVIGYCEPGKEPLTFTGTVEGNIAYEEKGEGGFGYDPIFLYGARTFGEMGDEEKNKVSHRKRAVDRFVEWVDSNL